jgi:small conductance mechanosensitive channel
MNSGINSLDQVKGTLIDLALRFGPKLVTAILILTAGFFVAGWVGRAMLKALHRFDLEPPMRMLFTRVARVLVVLLFAILALQNLGVELLPLIAGLGVAGAGIALAMQGVLSNVVAGLSIIFTKPYRVGEYVAAVGVEGQVYTISLFSTTLLHPDHSHVVVPNRKVVGEILQNFGKIRQATITVGVDYDTDLRAALEVIRDVVRANPRVLKDPAPLIQAVELADSAIEISMKPWVAVTDYGAIAGEINVAVVEELRRRGIGIPYPRREIRMLSAAA